MREEALARNFELAFTAMSLCFLEAFKQKESGTITQDEYMNHLLAHCQGEDHEEDAMMPWDAPIFELKDSDLFGYSIWVWSKKVDQMKGTSNHVLNRQVY